MITKAIQDNLDIVVDNMNLSTSSLKEVQEIVKNFDYIIEYKDFTKVPLEVCIERDSKRLNPMDLRL